MAKKDFSGSENIDRNKKGSENESLQSEASQNQTDQREPGTTEVKNAHAVGDGSFGRNESSLPEKEEDEKQIGNSNY